MGFRKARAFQFLAIESRDLIPMTAACCKNIAHCKDSCSYPVSLTFRLHRNAAFTYLSLPMG
jgi:hypothetical protein